MKNLNSSSTKKRTGPYYGYIIVATCFIIMLVGFGTQLSFGVFFKPILEDFGWTRAVTSIPFSLNLLLGAVFSIISGKLSDKFGPRKVVTAAGLILGIGYILTSMASNLWQFYLFYGVFAAIGIGSIWVPLSSTITRWFMRNRSLMTGIGISGLGMGIAVFPLASSHLIEKYAWRTSLLILGIIATITIVTLAQLLKREPGHAETQTNISDRDMGRAPVLNRGLSFNEAWKTRTFWMLAIAWVLYGVFYQAGTIHLVPYANDLGMSSVASATLLTVMGLIGVPGRIAMGFLGDKYSNKTTIIISLTSLTIAFLGLVFSRTVGSLYFFAVFFGIFSGIGILLAPLIADLFGLKSLGTVTGTIVAANSIGGAIGPTLAGGIFDATGSYHWAFVLCAVAGITGTIMLFFIKPVLKR